ncbi:type 2 periplasmic-binding domain-containing protein [Vallitalea okinawensis]|uniref:extracellular solute-binding protein n=1 Tax=Vallitalea okinawensis TaxID=2078660 RepID=UPI000CFD3B38|nr:extracellular solute-binding protein [Vallitalea okinawensis]
MKKGVALTLAVWMMISIMLTGCGGEKVSDEANNTSTDDVSKEVTTDEDGREMVGNMYVEGLPIVKEQETFTIFVDDGGRAEDKIMYPILEEQTNVKVELLLYPYDTALEKKNILINSGEYPDVFAGWILGQKDILKDGMEDGLYIPIDGYIEKYAPNMREVLDIKGVRQTMTLPDGHIYTIPYVIEAPHVDFSPWINYEWLEAVGKDMPTTTEEFRDVLRAFKTEDPNGNGINDEIPYSASPDNLNFGYLAGWFGVSAGQKEPMGFAMADGELVYQYNTEGYKETMKYLNSLYEEGLIDPEIFTQDSAQWTAKGKQDLYGCSMAYGPGDFVDVDVATNRSAFDPLPVLKSEFVDTPNYARSTYGAATLKTQVAITDRAKNPEVIVRWFDNVFELENSVQIQAGLIGKRIEKLGEGQYRALDETLLSEADREKYGWGNMFTQSMPKFIPLDFKVLPVEGKELPYNDKKTADELYAPHLTEAIPQAWATAEDAKRVSIIETDIKNYIVKKQAEWISGQTDVEAEWEDYVEQLDKLGLQELIEMRRRAVDSAQ